MWLGKPVCEGGSGTASLDEIEKIVNEREEEWKEKFESLWLERETEKDQELEEAKTDLKTRSKVRKLYLSLIWKFNYQSNKLLILFTRDKYSSNDL